MRPLRLIIKGFGTYLEEQDLDFSVLKDRNIFVITGDTGAGKTTIFDAMNFALYGDASGKDREGISFRSDFATPEEETKVEFWFELRDKTYYVRREPAYMEKKLKGEGEKEHKPYAELKLPDGKMITGVKPVTAEIENLLGINKEQFRQIVMIPQGEFKKLLTADSQEREKIFRKIFGTEIFEKIQNRVNAKANELDKEVRLKRHERDTKLRDFDCKDTEEELFRMLQADAIHLNEVFNRAKEVLHKDKETHAKAGEEITILETMIEAFNKELVQGENINRKFEDLKNCETAFKALTENKPLFAAKKLQLEKARKALALKGFEEKWEEKKKAALFHKAAFEKISEERKNLKEAFDKSVGVLNEEKAKEEERKTLEKMLNDLDKLKDKAKKYDTSREKALQIQKEAEAVKAIYSQLTQKIEADEAAIKSIEITMLKVIEAEKEQLQAENQLKELSNQKEELHTLKNTLEAYKVQKEKHKSLSEAFKAVDIAFFETKKNYEAAEESFRKGQAGLLAQGLTEGMPCPVCGSKNHPSPAVPLDQTINEEAVDKEKGIFEASRVTRDEKLTELTELNSGITLTLEQNIKPLVRKLLSKEELTTLKTIYGEVNELISQNALSITEKTKDLKILKELTAQKEELLKNKENFSEALAIAKEKLKSETENLSVKQSELSAANEQLKMIEEEFKGKVKTYAEITTDIEKLQIQLQTLIKAYRTAEETHQLASKALGEADGQIISMTSTLNIAQKEKEEAQDIFKEKTLSLGFEDYKDYKAYSIAENEIEVLDQSIQHFESSLEANKKLYEKARDEVKDLDPVSLDVLKEKVAKLNSKKAQAMETQQMLFARLQNNQKVLKEAKAISEKIETKEQKYQTLGELAKVMKGDNEYKISFERFVLAAYFDDIVDASNTRFNKMTGGRFELLRKTQKGDARSQQGLDLEVMDNYTGKARAVETLSGGESFKASLAMALGLADVVQSYAGGIQLDTMFVDEGFGTLDPESLENAVECLVGLQKSGRLVGIISHVPELKERIDTRLEVKRIARGSEAGFKV